MIPENENTTNYKQIVIDRILKKLETSNYVSIFRNECYNSVIAENVAKMFSKKKYYVKINYFLNGQMQMLVVSRNPLKETTGRMIYSVEF